MYHDLGSGSNVDVWVIKAGRAEYFRNLKHDNCKVYHKPGGYSFKPDRIEVFEEYNHPSASA